MAADLLSSGGCVVTALEDERGMMAAIMAAVTAYLEEEERARLAARRLAPISPWRLIGRRQAMRPRAPWRRRMA